MQEITFQRVRWIKWLLSILDAYLIGTSIWLFISLSYAKNPKALLIAMTVMAAAFSVLLFVFALLSWLKKVNALTLKEDRLIVRDYKEKTILLKDVDAFRYARNHAGGCSRCVSLGQYKSGRIDIVLKDKTVVRVKDLKDAAKVCGILNSKIRVN